MNKIIIAPMAIYLPGDPELQYLSWLGKIKIYVVVASLYLACMPGSPRSSTVDPHTVTASTPSLRAGGLRVTILLHKNTPQSFWGAELLLCMAGYYLHLPRLKR